MAERRYATVSEIKRYAAKGDGGTSLQSAAFVQGAGLEGDLRADGGERQLCLLSREAALWMAAHDIPGLCFARFKANLVLDTASGEPFRRLSAGERLLAGEAELEITDAAKRCHDWPGSGCRLRDAGLACLLTTHTMFAKVTRSGRVNVGDTVTLEEETWAAKPGFSHFDSGGNAIMVDVSAKPQTARVAVAKGSIIMNGETLRAIRGKTAAKGDVLGVARVAGIMAAKKTAGLIPLCHSLSLDSCALDFTLEDGPPRVEATCTVKVSGRTGAEMEAMTGVSIALLTVYDMCKAIDRSMEIGEIKLWEKSGGKSGRFTRAETD